VFQRLTLGAALLFLAYGFWASPVFSDIAAGVAVFLFGMLCMEEGFKAFSGGTLERLLHTSTEGTGKSLLFGLVTTTLMQSSSLVSVITISFLSAGLLKLGGAMGIIFGANLGTTTGAWIVAGFGLKVDIGAFAMPILVVGVLLLFQKARGIKGLGWVLVGLGFLFLGIHFMKEGFADFSGSLDLTAYALDGVAGLLLYTLFGALATVVMQSSHATLVLIITALSANQITYDNALALAIGANIGTTVTAVIGALGASVDGKRLAGAHLVFNVGTGLIALVFIDVFVVAVQAIGDWIGIAEGDEALRLAVFHTLFNGLGVALFVPLIGPMSRGLERVLKGEHVARDRARYVSEASLELPEIALSAMRLETHHLFNNAFSIIAHGIDLRRADINSDRDLLELLHPRSDVIEIDIEAQYERMIKDIYSANMVFYTRALTRMPQPMARQMQSLWQANLDIVAAIKAVKHLRKNLVAYSRSSNLFIRKEYNRLRIQIGELLREIAVLREADPDAVAILSLDGLRVHVEDSRRFSHQIVDTLIRDGSITAQMATSLMNDSGYAHEVMGHLLSMAEGMLVAGGLDEEAGELALSPEELQAVIEEMPAAAQERSP
jgi:phosphate:Na+ symporter